MRHRTIIADGLSHVAPQLGEVIGRDVTVHEHTDFVVLAAVLALHRRLAAVEAALGEEPS